MEFLFSWSTWYLTCSLSSLLRYCVEHSNRISTFLFAHILFFISFSHEQQSSWPMGEANNNRLLTKLTRAVLGNIGPRSWLKLGRYCHDQGPIFPSTARVTSVSELFIMWHSVSDSKMHFQWLAPSSSSVFEILEKFQSFWLLLVVSMWRMTSFTLFFFAVLVANFELAGFAPKQKNTDWTISMETVRSVLQNHDRERTNQSAGIFLRLGLPYNNTPYEICMYLIRVHIQYEIVKLVIFDRRGSDASWRLLESKHCNHSDKYWLADAQKSCK